MIIQSRWLDTRQYVSLWFTSAIFGELCQFVEVLCFLLYGKTQVDCYTCENYGYQENPDTHIGKPISKQGERQT